MTESSAPDAAAAASPLSIHHRHLARGELAFQRDADGRALFFPRVAAPAGYRAPLRWDVSAGLGTVYAATYIAPKGEPAYSVVLVEMDEGFRLMSRVESLPAEQVGIGMRVRLRVVPGQGDEGPLPVFDPIDGDVAPAIAGASA